MQFETDRTNEPSLPEMVNTAIDILQKEENGFFLIVEGKMYFHQVLSVQRDITILYIVNYMFYRKNEA